MKYKLTDKWPEPMRGKKITLLTNENVVFGYHLFGDKDFYQCRWSKNFVESNPDLFEAVRDVEFNGYMLGNPDGTHYTDRMTLHWKNNSGKQITTDEIIEALNKHFNE